MEKPLILRKIELKDDVLNAINKAKLPAHEILPFVESLYNSIQQQVNQEYMEALESYNDSLEPKEESDEEDFGDEE